MLANLKGLESLKRLANLIHLLIAIQEMQCMDTTQLGAHSKDVIKHNVAFSSYHFFPIKTPKMIKIALAK